MTVGHTKSINCLKCFNHNVTLREGRPLSYLPQYPNKTLDKINNLCYNVLVNRTKEVTNNDNKRFRNDTNIKE